jgi:D-amino-acid dehydrogenase
MNKSMGADDVVIVGAGIIGIMAAFYLQASGRQVTLIDKGEPADAASRGNAGALAFADIMPLASPKIALRAPRWLIDPLGPLSVPPGDLGTTLPWLLRFLRASLPDRVARSVTAQAALNRLAENEMAATAERSRTQAMFRSLGALELYESEAERRASLPGWRLRADHGIAFRHLDRAALDDAQPGLAPRFHSGTMVDDWQVVSDPYDLARAILAATCDAGARIMRDEVVAIAPGADAGASCLVTTRTHGRLTAGHCVLAAGPWSGALANGLGDAIPVAAERGYNTTLPVTAFDIRHQLIFSGHGFVISPLATGVRIGGASEIAAIDRSPDMRRARAMLDKAAAFLPGLGVTGGTAWCGTRPSMPDSLPVIGRARTAPRVIYAFGHGHLGLTQSAATGRLVHDLVAGQPPAIDLAPFDPNRFKARS